MLKRQAMKIILERYPDTIFLREMLEGGKENDLEKLIKGDEDIVNYYFRKTIEKKSKIGKLNGIEILLFRNIFKTKSFSEFKKEYIKDDEDYNVGALMYSLFLHNLSSIKKAYNILKKTKKELIDKYKIDPLSEMYKVSAEKTKIQASSIFFDLLDAKEIFNAYIPSSEMLSNIINKDFSQKRIAEIERNTQKIREAFDIIDTFPPEKQKEYCDKLLQSDDKMKVIEEILEEYKKGKGL